MRKINFMALCVGVLISSVSEAGDVRTVGDISAIQADIIYYEAMAKKAEAKRKVVENGGYLPGYESERQKQSPVHGVPILSGVVGSAQGLYATLRYPSGQVYEVKKGDRLPDGSTVDQITVDTVSITKSNETIDILFSGPRRFNESPQDAPQTLPGSNGG